MLAEYVRNESNRGRDPPEILEADPNVLMENAIAQRRPMDSQWFKPEATNKVYPRHLIRRFNNSEPDPDYDPTVPTRPGYQQWPPGWGSPECFHATNQDWEKFVYPEMRNDKYSKYRDVNGIEHSKCKFPYIWCMSLPGRIQI